MAEDPAESKPTREQVVADVLQLGDLLDQHAHPRTTCIVMPSPPISPEESARLKAEIARLETRIENCAYDRGNRTLRAVLAIRKDEVVDLVLLRCIASVAFMVLTSGRSRPTVSIISRMAGCGDWKITVAARHAIRLAIIKGNGINFSDSDYGDGVIKPGPDLVRLLSGDNALPIVWTEATLKQEHEDWQRTKSANVPKRVSPPNEATKPAPINPSVPQVSLNGCESPKAIFTALSRTVLGMDGTDTLRRFSVAMSLHLRRVLQIRQGSVLTTPCQTLLIAGESGVGKTFLVEEFCKIANLPYTIGNLAECTSSGYVGIDLADILAGLFRNGAKRSEIEAGSIIFFDEADKRRINDRQGFDCTGSGLQAEILRMVEGADIQLGGRRSNENAKCMLSTRGFAFCLAGCFEGITQIMENQSRSKQPLGFGNSIEYIGQIPDIRSALATYFLPELCNRILTILYIRPPDLTALYQIATAPHGVLAKQNQFLAGMGLTLKPDEQAVKEICAYSHSSKTFARGIRSLFQALAEDAIFEEWNGELVIGVKEVRRALDGLRQGGAGHK